MAEDNIWHSTTISYVNKTDILDENGMIKTDVFPTSAMGTKITISVTPPENPQVNDLWIQIE
jgi:hypothetical protein